MDIEILNKIKKYKKEAVKDKDNNLSNELWCYEQIYMIQDRYLKTFKKLKNHLFAEAWRDLERIDINISFLLNNKEYIDNEYNIRQIRNVIQNYQKLYPYFVFGSRESVIKKEICSICGEERSIRGSCKHRKGKLYMGELAMGVIKDIQILAISLVSDPVDLYSVIKPKDKKYNYIALEKLMSKLDTPYRKWNVTIEKIKKDKYYDIGRNELCPCDSGKKYKLCCLNTEKEFNDHNRINIYGIKGISIPRIRYNTWKE